MKDQLRLLRDCINNDRPATVKLPKLSPTETELVREEMTKR